MPKTFPLLIAEIANTHGGNINYLKEIIRKTQQTKVDAIKFQAFKAENVVSRNAEKAPYQKDTTNKIETQFEMIKKLELSDEDLKRLSDYTRKRGLIFLSSPFDKESVDCLQEFIRKDVVIQIIKNNIKESKETDYSKIYHNLQEKYLELSEKYYNLKDSLD